MTTNPPPPFPSFYGADPPDDEAPREGEPVGASDARADAVASGADDPDAGPFHRPPLHGDTEGVPVGREDAEADAERSREGEE